jgi:hypothetical protein
MKPWQNHSELEQGRPILPNQIKAPHNTTDPSSTTVNIAKEKIKKKEIEPEEDVPQNFAKEKRKKQRKHTGKGQSNGVSDLSGER